MVMRWQALEVDKIASVPHERPKTEAYMGHAVSDAPSQNVRAPGRKRPLISHGARGDGRRTALDPYARRYDGYPARKIRVCRARGRYVCKRRHSCLRDPLPLKLGEYVLYIWEIHPTKLGWIPDKDGDCSDRPTRDTARRDDSWTNMAAGDRGPAYPRYPLICQRVPPSFLRIA